MKNLERVQNLGSGQTAGPPRYPRQHLCTALGDPSRRPRRPHTAPFWPHTCADQLCDVEVRIGEQVRAPTRGGGVMWKGCGKRAANEPRFPGRKKDILSG